MSIPRSPTLSDATKYAVALIKEKSKPIRTESGAVSTIKNFQHSVRNMNYNLSRNLQTEKKSNPVLIPLYTSFATERTNTFQELKSMSVARNPLGAIHKLSGVQLVSAMTTAAQSYPFHDHLWVQLGDKLDLVYHNLSPSMLTHVLFSYYKRDSTLSSSSLDYKNDFTWQTFNYLTYISNVPLGSSNTNLNKNLLIKIMTHALLQPSILSLGDWSRLMVSAIHLNLLSSSDFRVRVLKDFDEYCLPLIASISDKQMKAEKGIRVHKIASMLLSGLHDLSASELFDEYHRSNDILADELFSKLFLKASSGLFDELERSITYIKSNKDGASSLSFNSDNNKFELKNEFDVDEFEVFDDPSKLVLPASSDAKGRPFSAKETSKRNLSNSVTVSSVDVAQIVACLGSMHVIQKKYFLMALDFFELTSPCLFKHYTSKKSLNNSTTNLNNSNNTPNNETLLSQKFLMDRLQQSRYYSGGFYDHASHVFKQFQYLSAVDKISLNQKVSGLVSSHQNKSLSITSLASSASHGAASSSFHAPTVACTNVMVSPTRQLQQNIPSLSHTLDDLEDLKKAEMMRKTHVLGLKKLASAATFASNNNDLTQTKWTYRSLCKLVRSCHAAGISNLYLTNQFSYCFRQVMHNLKVNEILMGLELCIKLNLFPRHLLRRSFNKLNQACLREKISLKDAIRISNILLQLPYFSSRLHAQISRRFLRLHASQWAIHLKPMTSIDRFNEPDYLVREITQSNNNNSNSSTHQTNSHQTNSHQSNSHQSNTVENSLIEGDHSKEIASKNEEIDLAVYESLSANSIIEKPFIIPWRPIEYFNPDVVSGDVFMHANTSIFSLFHYLNQEQLVKGPNMKKTIEACFMHFRQNSHMHMNSMIHFLNQLSKRQLLINSQNQNEKSEISSFFDEKEFDAMYFKLHNWLAKKTEDWAVENFHIFSSFLKIKKRFYSSKNEDQQKNNETISDAEVNFVRIMKDNINVLSDSSLDDVLLFLDYFVDYSELNNTADFEVFDACIHQINKSLNQTIKNQLYISQSNILTLLHVLSKIDQLDRTNGNLHQKINNIIEENLLNYIVHHFHQFSADQLMLIFCTMHDYCLRHQKYTNITKIMRYLSETNGDQAKERSSKKCLLTFTSSHMKQYVASVLHDKRDNHNQKMMKECMFIAAVEPGWMRTPLEDLDANSMQVSANDRIRFEAASLNTEAYGGELMKQNKENDYIKMWMMCKYDEGRESPDFDAEFDQLCAKFLKIKSENFDLEHKIVWVNFFDNLFKDFIFNQRH